MDVFRSSYKRRRQPVGGLVQGEREERGQDAKAKGKGVFVAHRHRALYGAFKAECDSCSQYSNSPTLAPSSGGWSAKKSGAWDESVGASELQQKRQSGHAYPAQQVCPHHVEDEAANQQVGMPSCRACKKRSSCHRSTV